MKPNISKVTRMAVLSGNAYKYVDIKRLPPKAIKSYNRTLVYTNPEEKQHTIVVRGSMLLKKPTDVLMNVNIKSVNYNDLSIHRGFFNEAVKIKQIMEANNILQEGYRVDLTGHSSGGCIACILALLMQETSDTIGDVITFGQPKFIKHLYKCPINCVRAVNIADPIPILPIWDYKHMGTPLILDEHNQGDVPRLCAHEMRSYINNLVLNFVGSV
jgi:predicted lipase